MWNEAQEKNLVGYSGGQLGRITRLSMTERLRERKEQLLLELKQVVDTLAILEGNPQIQQVLDSLAKLNFTF